VCIYNSGFFMVVCFGTAYWHLIMKDKCFKCIDLFIVNVDRTNPLAHVCIIILLT